MKYSLNIEDDIFAILEKIASDIIHPDSFEALTVEERLETAINALANSLDSAAEDTVKATGEPIDAAALKAALKATVDPDISTVFKPPEGEAKLDVKPLLTLEEIKTKSPKCWALDLFKDLTKEKEPELYGLTEQAVRAVLTAVPLDEWSTENTQVLVARTLGQLLGVGKAAATNAG